MNPRRLIVNADDYGRSLAVSRGIRQAHRQGIVTSTSVMMNMQNADEDLHLAQLEVPRLGLGVHLTLTAGRPLCAPENVPTLVDDEGQFWRLEDFILRLDGINLNEVLLEWHLQAECFRMQTGILPTHFDSHHHCSYFTPGLFRLMLELANDYHCAIRYGIPPEGDPDTQGIPLDRLADIQKAAPPLLETIRIPHPDVLLGSFYDQTATRENLLTIINNLPEGVSELMCHPGIMDEALFTSSTYNRQRERELAILTDPEVFFAVERKGVLLISFGKMGGMSGINQTGAI